MSPPTLPSLYELSRGMQGSSRTEKWDVVVSYSIDQLNALLQKLWKADPPAKTAQFTVPREGPGHTKYWTDFDVTFAAPSLTFTLSKSARLKMALSGTYHDRTEDKTFPDDKIPSGYYFEAILPIICVSAEVNVIGKVRFLLLSVVPLLTAFFSKVFGDGRDYLFRHKQDQ